jgi:hypothetical protein
LWEFLAHGKRSERLIADDHIRNKAAVARKVLGGRGSASVDALCKEAVDALDGRVAELMRALATFEVARGFILREASAMLRCTSVGRRELISPHDPAVIDLNETLTLVFWTKAADMHQTERVAYSDDGSMPLREFFKSRMDSIAESAEREVLLINERRRRTILLDTASQLGAQLAAWRPRTALTHIEGEVVIIQDADLEYDPAELTRLVAQILAGEADVVYGSRFREALPPSSWPHQLANRFLTWCSNRLTGLQLTDMETCYKVMRRDVVKSLTLREDRFGFEPEITAKIARGRWRIVESPVSYRPRTRHAGKKIGIRDGLRALWCILRYSRWD